MKCELTIENKISLLQMPTWNTKHMSGYTGYSESKIRIIKRKLKRVPYSNNEVVVNDFLMLLGTNAESEISKLLKLSKVSNSNKKIVKKEKEMN